MGNPLYFTLDIDKRFKDILIFFSNENLKIYDKYKIDDICLSVFKDETGQLDFQVEDYKLLQKYINSEYDWLSFSLTKEATEYISELYISYYEYSNVFKIGLPHKFQKENKDLILEVLDDFCKLLHPRRIYSAGDSYDTIEEIRKNVEPNSFNGFYRDKDEKLQNYDYSKDFERIVNKYKK